MKIRCKSNFVGSDIKSNSDQLQIELNPYRIGCNPIIYFYAIFALFFIPTLFLLSCKYNLNHMFNAKHFLYQAFQCVQVKKYWKKKTWIHFKGKGIYSSTTVGRKCKKSTTSIHKEERSRRRSREKRKLVNKEEYIAHRVRTLCECF